MFFDSANSLLSGKIRVVSKIRGVNRRVPPFFLRAGKLRD